MSVGARSAPVSPLTTTAAARLHLGVHRFEIAGVERAPRGREQHRLLDVDVRAVGILERIRRPYEVRSLGAPDRALERGGELALSDVTGRELAEDVRELGDALEPREERALLVLLVSRDLPREEIGDLARRLEVGRVLADRMGEIGKALFQTAVRARELLERIGRAAHVRAPALIFSRRGIASAITRGNDGRAARRSAHAVRFSCWSNGTSLRA